MNAVAPAVTAVPNADPVPQFTPEASPELVALREEAGLWIQVFSVISNASIKALECRTAMKILDRLQIEVSKAEAAVEERLKFEASLKPKAGEKIQ